MSLQIYTIIKTPDLNWIDMPMWDGWHEPLLWQTCNIYSHIFVVIAFCSHSTERTGVLEIFKFQNQSSVWILDSVFWGGGGHTELSTGHLTRPGGTLTRPEPRSPTKSLTRLDSLPPSISWVQHSCCQQGTIIIVAWFIICMICDWVRGHSKSVSYIYIYTEHCSVGPTKLIETATTTASTRTRTRMRISKFRFLNLDF